MTQRIKRQWMFNTPANNSGDRFRTHNIPSEASYRTLSFGVPFISEADDAAKIHERGLVFLYSETQAIQERYKNDASKGDSRAVRSHQLPGVGITDLTSFQEARYIESNPESSSVSGEGIEVEAVKSSQFGFDKLSYQVKLSPGSLKTYIAEANEELKMIVYDAHNKITSIRNLTEGDLHIYSQEDFALSWTINHNLGKYPAVTIMDNNGNEITGQINHTSKYQTVINFNQATAGSASFN